MNLHSKTVELEKMILWLLSCLKIILISRTMNIITWKAYLRNSYYVLYINLLETWWRAAKIETFILGFSYNSFQNVVRVLPLFSNWLRRLDPSVSNSVVTCKRDFFRNMASENNREALSVRNTFIYVDIGRLEGSNPNSDYEIFNSSVGLQIIYYCVT